MFMVNEMSEGNNLIDLDFESVKNAIFSLMSKTIKNTKQSLLIEEQENVDLYVTDLNLKESLIFTQSSFKNYAHDFNNVSYSKVSSFLQLIRVNSNYISIGFQCIADDTKLASSIIKKINDIYECAVTVTAEFDNDYSDITNFFSDNIQNRISELQGSDGMEKTRAEIKKCQEKMSEDLDKILEINKDIGKNISKIVVKYLKDAVMPLQANKKMKDNNVEKRNLSRGENGLKKDPTDDIKIISDIGSDEVEVKKIFDDINENIVELDRLYQTLAKENAAIAMATTIELQSNDFNNYYKEIHPKAEDTEKAWLDVYSKYSDLKDSLLNMSESDSNALSKLWADLSVYAKYVSDQMYISNN
ncbi:hypothetical protein Pcaca03_02980 [Pectobacterium carotovorum subsp. carotovorum]|uniref:Uncharacterized protein n=2 Tax=Pectobacterium carotovorum TaxID=554 RepID=A0AAI9KYQ5_PECCC|nr:hypothetical protein SOASR016_02980 [Pectobacterium carotovorum subsp. carotovorum]GLV67854.1 hypothetical protein Pcaca03_02980 [Pectobacterium carotovorum subsp. carotovorum]